ncbi:hypothetical protein Nepgr_005852 [Nepenthes gracilis]|uniref:Uncharacterized protein n=1 Tax=Nepenthes gracilis TaxID=150966 RepID=A0AAD3S431_NEPGR|nr:hypothetical protein Nepgr_005852 [Nepenthes gracilis]
MTQVVAIIAPFEPDSLLALLHLIPLRFLEPHSIPPPKNKIGWFIHASITSLSLGNHVSCTIHRLDEGRIVLWELTDGVAVNLSSATMLRHLRELFQLDLDNYMMVNCGTDVLFREFLSPWTLKLRFINCCICILEKLQQELGVRLVLDPVCVLWWTSLSIASSIGLGSGLHTFVKHLEPHIAQVTIKGHQSTDVWPSSQPRCIFTLVIQCGRRFVELLLGPDFILPQASVHALVIVHYRGFKEVVDMLWRNGLDTNSFDCVLLQSNKPSLHTNVDYTVLVAATVDFMMLQFALEMEHISNGALVDKTNTRSGKVCPDFLLTKQWFTLLQLESLCLQIKDMNPKISTPLPILVPWTPFRPGTLQKSWQKTTKVKRRKHDIGKYAVAIAVGLSLVGAGLLLEMDISSAGGSSAQHDVETWQQ